MAERIENIFDASSHNVHDTLALVNATAFKIPEYQRGYTWEEDKIESFVLSPIEGLKHAIDSNDDFFSFIGSVITVSKHTTHTVIRTQQDIVDGQQRLTTTMILAGTLRARILALAGQVDHLDLDEDSLQWLRTIIERVVNDLLELFCYRYETKRYVRMIQDDDSWAHDGSGYHSLTSKVLETFTGDDSYSLNRVIDRAYEEYLGLDSSQRGILERFRLIQRYVTHNIEPGTSVDFNRDLVLDIHGQHPAPWSRQSGIISRSSSRYARL